MASAVIVVGFVVLAAALVGGIVARALLWTPRRVDVSASSRVPTTSVLGGADVLAAPDVALAAQLLDWHVRGVVSVASRGPVLEQDAAAGVSGGPRWVVTLRDADRDDLHEDERMALAGLFDDDASSGAVLQLAQDDQVARDLLAEAQDLARGVRHEEFGPRRPVAVALAIALAALAVLAAIVVIVAAVIALPEVGVGGMLALQIPAAILAAGVLALCARPSLPPPREREVAAEVRALEQLIRSADRTQVTPELLGWALLLRMPPPWSMAVPAAVAALVEHPASFRPVPRPSAYEYTG